MKKNLLLFFIWLPLLGFSQNTEQLREQAESYYEKGDFLKSYEILKNIKDKNILENTNVNLHKANLEDILNHRFFKKVQVNDSLYKVYIKTKVLKSQGIYNERAKKYTIAPVYDSIHFEPNFYRKFLNVYKNNLSALVNIESGKIIVPLGNHYIEYHSNLVLVDKKNKYGVFMFDDILDVYDVDGNLLFKDLNTVELLTENYIRTKNKNGKYQIIDLKSKKVVLDDCDYINKPYYTMDDNNVTGITWLPFQKNNINYLYKITSNGIVVSDQFDTYIPMFYSYNYFDNAISRMVNIKEHAILCPDIENQNCYSKSYEYTIVKKDAKYGIFNIAKNKFYKEPVYDSISEIGNTFYQGKWINLLYNEEICMPSDKEPQGIIFKKSNLLGLMDLGGKIILEANYDEITQGHPYGVFNIRKGTKWGFMGVSKNAKIVAPEFDFISVNSSTGNSVLHKNKKAIEYLSNGSKAVIVDQQKKRIGKRYIESNSSFLITHSDTEKSNRLIFVKDGKYGLDDLYQNEILPGKYSEIREISENVFIASSDTLKNLKGLIDQDGKELIPLKYTNIEYKTFQSNILFVTNSQGLQALFTTKGEMLYPFKIKELKDTKFAFKSNTEYFKIKEITDNAPLNFDIENPKFYKFSVLKIKGQKLEKLNIESNYFEFLKTDFLVYQSNEKNGFYNLENGKIIDPEFNAGLFDDQTNNRIFVRKGQYFDTVIDSTNTITTLEYSFFEMKNGNYFYKEDNKTGVMNKDLKVANFKYPLLKNMIELDGYYSNINYKEKASSYFKFDTDINSTKNGLISFDGTIIVEPGIYDDVRMLYLGREVNENKYEANKHLKKYGDRVFIGINTNKNDSKAIKLITDKRENIAAFELKKNESWDFSTLNNTVIIKSTDSVKLYDLESKKFQLKIKANQFREDRDYGYTASDFDYKLSKNTFKKYDFKGKIILDTIMDSNRQYYAISDDNYIFKRNNKYGTLNSKVEPGIPFVYDNLESKNARLFISKKNDLYGIIDGDNQTLVDQKYQEINWFELKDKYSGVTVVFSAFKVKENNKWGLLDLNTKTLLSTEFDEIKIYENWLTAKKDAAVSVYQLNGKLLFTAAVDSINTDIYNNYLFYKNGKQVFRDNEGSIVDKNPSKSGEDQTKETYSKVIDGKRYFVKKNSIVYKTPIKNVYIINADRNFMGENLDYLLVEDENNLKGLYTLDFKPIFPFVYNDLIIRENSFIITNKNNKYGVVNLKNQIVIPFEYDKIDYRGNFFKCIKNSKVLNITPQNKVIYLEK